MSRLSRDSPHIVMMLAGWLFADLALGLVVILLGTATDAPVVGPSTSPSTAPPSTPPPTGPVSVEKEPYVFVVASDSGALRGRSPRETARVVTSISRSLAAPVRNRRRAAFVLTFGCSRSPNDGVALAKLANSLLKRAAPALMDGAAVRDFWKAEGSEGARSGTLTFEIYLFTGRW